MDAEMIAALIGLGGVALASLLGGLGYFLKTQAEILKSRRVVLFYLLEMRHAFLANMFEPKDILKQYLAYCDDFFKRHGIIDAGEMPEDVKDLLLSHLGASRDMVQHRLEEEIIAPFIGSLNEMAKQAPLMAFKIRGKESIGKLIRLQESYAERAQETASIAATPLLSQVLTSQFEKLKSTNISELANELNQSIRMVALSCGLFTYFGCKKILKSEVKSEIDFSEMGLDDLLKGFMQALQKAAAEEGKAPAPFIDSLSQ
ncbi:MAG: hypothetical protein K0S46_2177 [Moraxellaceae bacterium]|nr:hypothetical protein [Moraxellaceae bacterium]